jgi:hypothetical protein
MVQTKFVEFFPYKTLKLQKKSQMKYNSASTNASTESILI